MAKRKVRVINRGKRIRDRLGSRFLPNQPQELEVNSRQYLTLKAVKDFDVEILDSDNDTDSNNTVNSNVDNDSQIHSDVDNDIDSSIDDDVVNDGENDAEYSQDDEVLDYYDLNIEEVLKAVREGIFDVDEAIAYEVAGKNRVTLLEKLEDLKASE